MSRPPIISYPPPSNSLGVAGFTVSLLGLCTCGILSPLGLLLSVIAMRKRPKGLAITGMVLGMIGMVGLLLIALAAVFSAVRVERADVRVHRARAMADRIERSIEIAEGIAEQSVRPGNASQAEKVNAARAQVSAFETMLDVYSLDTGQYPTTEQGLIALREPPLGESRWDGPYIRENVPLDPWGNDYLYELLDTSRCRVHSRGPDGIDGNDDDI